MSATDDSSESQSIRNEVDDLEKRLANARLRLSAISSGDVVLTPPSIHLSDGPLATSPHHFLLLLADSQLPLGSFAFSSGLESYLAHTRPSSSFSAFLKLSISSYADTTLPFVLAAHRSPAELRALDDTLDASIMCTVGRRASVAQGRALLSIWDRSFSSAVPVGACPTAVQSLKEFTILLRSTSFSRMTLDDLPPASAHIGPLFGAIAFILGMSLEQTAYVFMLSHVKALLSAAVRASIFGPYAAQKILASVEVQQGIGETIRRKWDTNIHDAGQSIPAMDLWIGRHEMLYSRIFNS